MKKSKNDPYANLLEESKQSALLHSVLSILEWDQETYLPKEAIDIRSQQIELLASLAHKEKTSKRFSKALNQLIDIETGEIKDDTLSPEQIASLREWRRDHQKMIKLPASFVKTLAETKSKAIHAWAIAKERNDFASFAPHLEKLVKLNKKKSMLLGYKDHPYDALVDLYEPETTTAYLVPLFSKLKIALTELVKEIQSMPQPPTDFLRGEFAHSKQLHFGRLLLDAMGFDRATSRLDETAHPFCMGIHPTDTRMTTRIHADALMSNIFAVIHEGGHGLYNKGHPAQHFGSPLCESISLGIEESQSRFWETIIGHSYPFWEHFYPKLQKEFPEKLAEVPLEDFYRAINIVKPSLIRIESDEVTYSLHIIIRFEIEKGLIEGNIKVKDIPKIWNDKMREYLGIVPPSNAVGCLQDIHWSMGEMGYFPTYSLGNLYAAQFFETFEKTFPDWQARVKKGDLGFIREWLYENIHKHGRQFTPQELVIRITGKSLSEVPYVNYLRKKYKTLYHLS